MVFVLNIIFIFIFNACSTPALMARTLSTERMRKERQIEQKVHQKKSATRSKIRPSRLKFKSKSKLKLNYYSKDFQRWTQYFGKKNRSLFIRYLKRASRYEKLVRQTFKAHGLPQDLFFVGLIESGFSLGAYSRAKALGPWQFMKGTGKRYGLRVEKQVDERRNIHKATVAAASYFKDLYNIFGSWELALCAYNSGEYRVINAIRKGNSRDYRVLIRKKLLPRETAQYVPKVAAVRFLTQKREFKKYLASSPRESREYMARKELLLRRPFSLLNLAQKSGFSYRKLKKFNPDIRWNKIYPGRRPFRLIVPKKGFRLISSVVRKGKWSGKTKRERRYYRVKKGDSLSRIALKFGQKVSYLKRWNKILGERIFSGQKLYVGQRSKKYQANRFYVVRRGDSLFKIAKRFGTSIYKIRKINSLEDKVIHPKQKILIPVES